MTDRRTGYKFLRAAGAVVGYGCLTAFTYLVCLQLYRWFREGEWTHVGTSDALRVSLARCCVREGDTGRLAALQHWLDTPLDWLGLHRAMEVVPASLVLFLLAVAGNCLALYCHDRLYETEEGVS